MYRRSILNESTLRFKNELVDEISSDLVDYVTYCEVEPSLSNIRERILFILIAWQGEMQFLGNT